jgi:hypothetical protein
MIGNGSKETKQKIAFSEVTVMMQTAKYTYVNQNVSGGILKQLEIRPILGKIAKYGTN